MNITGPVVTVIFFFIFYFLSNWRTSALNKYLHPARNLLLSLVTNNNGTRLSVVERVCYTRWGLNQLPSDARPSALRNELTRWTRF